MPQILPSESGWLATFPQVGLPHPDEWLAGLLLRCDEMNHLESGATWRYLLRATRHPGFGPGSPLIVVPESLLAYLAQRLLVSRECLLATTYACELARLYTLTPPHTGHLLGPRRGITIPLLLEKSVGNRANATVVGFHICPICIKQARLLRRTAILPHLKYCPTHHVAFHTHCRCGCPLILFCRGNLPFRCFACGLDWAQLPHLWPSPDEMQRESDLWDLYELFLGQGTPELKASALSLIRQHLKTHQPLALKLVSGRILLKFTADLNQLSLGYVLDLLVSMDLAPKEISNKQTV